jgi:putative two-component system hydrogenase maturation factor HypX/HoxX
MRVLLLVHSFNSLSQRLYVELIRDGHELSVEFDIHDRVTCEAVDLFRPDVILAPFLKRAIPSSVWQHCICLIVHPGPPGDRGPAALDWAILRGVDTWGVTILQANAQWDAGPVWASASFRMRAARKSSLYRHEVTEGAVSAAREALARIARGLGPVSAADGSAHGWQPPLRQAQRAIDWNDDDTATVLRKIHSADGVPGVEDSLFGRRFRLFDARAETLLAGHPGEVVASRHDAICRATRDGSVWIGQLQPVEGVQLGFKRPARLALGTLADTLPRSEGNLTDPNGFAGDGEIRYEEYGLVAMFISNCTTAPLPIRSASACVRHSRTRAGDRPESLYSWADLTSGVTGCTYIALKPQTAQRMPRGKTSISSTISSETF